MKPTQKRTLRWTLIMAILGFILGLGFLIPLPPPETRAPASEVEDTVAFLEPDWTRVERPKARSAPLSTAAGIVASGTAIVDPRTEVLFDVHTISRSIYAKDTDAYVTTEFTSFTRDEISRFVYCHNYDYKKQRARTNLNRYSLGADGFDCYDVPLEKLATEYVLVNTPFGKVLSLKSQPGFDPRKGGTISFLFAYHVAKLGRNDYRQLDLHVSLANGTIRITGPKGEAFDWFNLKMSEDLFNLPNGVNSFELYSKGARVSSYPGNSFPKPPVPRR